MTSDVEEIKSRTNIVDLIGGYVRLEKAGVNWKACCPFHNEKTPSFMVSEERQFWHCFGCQKSGDAFSFIMEIEGLEFKEALKILADKAGIKLQKYNSQEAGVKDKTFEILELATKFYEKQLWDGAGKIKILNYLKERGLNDETIREFRLGYAPTGWRNILQFLTGRGYSVAEINKTGLLVEKNSQDAKNNNQANPNPDYYDRFRDRITFPIADVMGKTVGFSARVAPGGDESQAKYVNTPETAVYHKSKALYGINKAKQEIKNKKFALLVEGNMDVIAAYQAGIKNTVAVSGTALTLEQVSIIKRYADKIKMFFDMDSAGENATKKSVKLCAEKEMTVSVVQLPEGKDAADAVKNDKENFIKQVENAKPYMAYFLDRIFSKRDKNDIEDRKIIINEALEEISALISETEKNYWIKELAGMISAGESDNAANEERALTDMLKKATLKKRTEKNFSNLPVAVFAPGEKTEMLFRELTGLMFAYGDAWKKVAEENSDSFLTEKNNLLKTAILKGGIAKYNFNNFVGLLENKEDATLAERLFFGKKYRIGLNNSPEETVLTNPLKEAEKILVEIRKELKKKELKKITEDLKKAESQKDKTAMEFLKNQFKKISSEN